ncbi:MAG: ankyrin repeat domain-containing protein [Sandaracinaceae bacterium]
MAATGGDWKALYEGARQGDVEEVRHWLSAGVNPDYQHVEFGTTPLIAAAENGHLDAAKALVEGGANPSVRSEWDEHDALEAARARGHQHVVRWLESL